MSPTTQTPAGTFGLDPIHSTIGFRVDYNGIAAFRSTFGEVTAQLADGVLSGAVNVASLQLGEPNLKGHLLSPEWFNVESSPTLSFRSTAIRISPEGDAEVDGELTVAGVTRPVTANGTYAEANDARGGERIGLGLAATIDRRDFGLGWQAPLPSGEPSLGWEVTLSVDLQLVKQA